MSEELRQKGYMTKSGDVTGDALGPYESFNIGATTLRQLRAAGVIPNRNYTRGTIKPDGLVVDRREAPQQIKLVVEYKNRGELGSELRNQEILKKVAEEYCLALDCPIAVISDGENHIWIHTNLGDGSWHMVKREDGYPFDRPVDLASVDGRTHVYAALQELDEKLDPATGLLVEIDSVDPTLLAERTWQKIWLASGENPDACLASFVEVLLFKFLSDLGILASNPAGLPIDFDTVRGKSNDQVLKYYFEYVRPEIKRLFPPGRDGTSVINGMVLRPNNVDHGALFAEILDSFYKEGTLKRIDPEFKSRVFERFLKQSISQKNWGQYFTPRNVVKAIVEMSGIAQLPDDAVVADPASGVGGFLLEPLVHKRKFDLRTGSGPSLKYRGWDRDPKTVILAKANMLIHLSEVLENEPQTAPTWLAPILNESFHSVHTSILGALSLMPINEYDLVMTNPPYVVSGTSTQRQAIARDEALSSYYSIGGTGVENLFLQLIMKGLKPGGRALVVVPDGLLLRHTEEALRRQLLNSCILEAIISLPENTFYSTPKKTYILAFRKKRAADTEQTTPVFSYLVSEIGETRNARRFPIPDNHLKSMAEQFRLFHGAPSVYTPPAGDLRIKVFSIARFQPEEHWLVDKWWSEDERVSLGETTPGQVINPEDLATRLNTLASELKEIAAVVENQDQVPHPEDTQLVRLADKNLFRLSIGKRVLQKDLHGLTPGEIPVYSANVAKPFGFVDSTWVQDFSYPSVLWGIDGDFVLAVKQVGAKFYYTDHCGRIEILNDQLDPSYCRAAIALARVHGFDRTLRPSLQRMKQLTFEVPVKTDGTFDLEAQRILAARYDSVVETINEVNTLLGSLKDLQPDVLLPSDD